MDWVLNLIPGGGLTGILALVATVVGSAIYFWRQAFKSGYSRKESENAKAARKNLENIKRAQRARPTGGMSDDPNNRDNR